MSRLLQLSLFIAAVLAAEEGKSAPPAFFLQDPTDSLCLSGEEFKRCSIDTLFYVVGSPGVYQIHKRPTDGTIDEEDDGICVSKKDCKADITKVAPTKLTKCSHCGAKSWNILGDADTGYVLTFDEKTCLVREKGTTKAMTAPCDSEEVPYTPLQLQFASAADIKTMSSPGARMIGAAADGDKSAIQAMLKDGVDINVRDWDELTALIPAASAGHMDVCKLLIKEGIDVNASDKDGITALMEASIMGEKKIVEFLLNSGATVDAAANSEVTALWLAASEGQTDVMKLLLSKGADAGNTRADGISALMTASVGGHEGAIKLLLENGADPTVADKDGLTPLMNAAENGAVSVLKALTEKSKEPNFLNAVSTTGFTALIIAAAHGHAPAIEYLLEIGAEVDASSSDNKVTALMYAAASNHVEAMKVLLEKGGAEVDAKHTNGGTPLLEASTGGAVDAIKMLIEKGAVVAFSDDDGVTPLMAIASQGSADGQKVVIEALQKTMSPAQLTEHINLLSYSGGSSVMFAAAGGHTECAKQLMDLGADIKAIARATPEYLEKLKEMIAAGTANTEDPHIDGVTALHVAAQGGHIETVKLLLEHAPEMATVKDEESRTPLTLAIKGNYGDVATALVAAGADPNTPYVDEAGVSRDLLFDALMVENEEFAKLLVEKGGNIYHQDEKKVTTLLQASHRGFVDVVKSILEKNTKDGFVDSASEEGVTPLLAASSEGHPEVVAALVAGGADVNKKDADETTALMAASARGHVQVVQELIKSGSEVNVQNKDGHTALMFAYNGKNQVETLWERYNQFVKDSDNQEDDSGTGPIIRKALDDHVALVDLLLKSGADASIKDKEGHTAKDFDFHPETDAEVLEKQANAHKVRDESKNEL